MLLVDPANLPPDLWGLVRSTMQLLHQGLLCLSAYLAPANILVNGGVQGTAAQYLLGLGELFSPVLRRRCAHRGVQALGTSPGSYPLTICALFELLTPF